MALCSTCATQGSFIDGGIPPERVNPGISSSLVGWGVLSPDEISQYQQLHLQLVADIEDLSQRILMAQEKVRQMEISRNGLIGLSRQVLACTTSSPIKRLPADLLRCIFFELSESILDDWEEERDGYVEDKALIRSPILLGSVCSYWRKLAESDPRLWRVVDLSSFSEKAAIRYFPSPDRNPLRRWFRCAGQLPILVTGISDLCVDLKTTGSEYDRSLIQIIYSKAKQFGSLSCSTLEIALLHEFRHFCFPNLTQLDLSGGRIALSLLLTVAPAVEYMKYIEDTPEIHTQDLTHPPARPSHLKFLELSLKSSLGHDLLNFLREVKNLESLSLALTGESWPRPVVENSINFPNLVDLVVTERHRPGSPSLVVTQFLAPALEKLTLILLPTVPHAQQQLPPATVGEASAQIAMFLEQSRCRLSHLTYKVPYHDTVEAVLASISCHQLQSLQLDLLCLAVLAVASGAVNNRFTSTLAQSNLPVLRELSVDIQFSRFSADFELANQALLDVICAVESRWLGNPLTTLRNFAVTMTSFATGPDILGCETLKSNPTESMLLLERFRPSGLHSSLTWNST